MSTVPLELDNPFWIFSLALYEAPGVGEACLAVQDDLGGDVNLLLFCAWCGIVRGVRLSEAELARLEAIIAKWNVAAVRPLRLARCSVKTLPIATDEAVAAFRKEVAAIELRAERIAQALLYREAPPLTETEGAATIAAENIRLYAGQLETALGKPEGSVSLASLIYVVATFSR